MITLFVDKYTTTSRENVSGLVNLLYNDLYILNFDQGDADATIDNIDEFWNIGSL